MSEFDQTPEEPQVAPEQPAYEAPPQQDFQAPPPQYQAPPPEYQAPPQYGQPVYAPVEPQMHIPSLILGILSIVFCWVPILGLVLGIVGMVLASKAKLTHKTKVGFILSIVGLIIGVIVLIFWVAVGAIAGAALGAAFM